MELKNSKIYIFKDKKCKQIHSNHPWKFKNNLKGQPFLSNSQNTAQIYFKQEIAVIKYQLNKAFFWTVSVGVISLHLSNDCQNAELFQFKLQEEDIKVVQWQNISDKLKRQVQTQCGSDINTKQNTQKGKVQKIGNKIGSLFGAFSLKFKGQVSNEVVSKSQIVQQQIKQKASDKNILREEQKAKWKKIKQQAKNINIKINQKVEPARETVAKAASKLGQKFNNSENRIIKGIREFGVEMKRSLNEGYRSSQCKDVNLQLNPQKPIQSERGLKNQNA